ncbi:2-hydroxyacid dehydrogenase [Rhodococcus triatomae]|nr:glyoxylate reductase [Rhodococcus triatomae BKS 15-14]
MSTPRFLVTMPLPDPAHSILSRAGSVEVWRDDVHPQNLSHAVASGDYSVVLTQLTDLLDVEVLASARLDGISNYAVGFDNIDIAAATARGIMVANTPGVLTAPTADIAMLLILATARRCVEGDSLVRSGSFAGWRPDLLLGHDVAGASLGLIGTGRIAAATGRRAAGFDMEVRHCSARGPRDTVRAGDHAVSLGTRLSFDELIETSDFISVHVPATPSTHHLIDSAALSRMRRNAILVNTARGPVVDEEALVHALRNGQIGGAGLDVYENEPHITPGLAQLRNTVLLPHLGSATIAVRARMAELCAVNAVAMARREVPPHPVNPEAWHV